jgi:hypothetical protein
MGKNGTNYLPEAIGTIKLPGRQIIGSSYNNQTDLLGDYGGGDRTRTCNPTIDVLTLTFA